MLHIKGGHGEGDVDEQLSTWRDEIDEGGAAANTNHKICWKI
jgi:hypothetical protein